MQCILGVTALWDMLPCKVCCGAEIYCTRIMSLKVLYTLGQNFLIGDYGIFFPRFRVRRTKKNK